MLCRPTARPSGKDTAAAGSLEPCAPPGSVALTVLPSPESPPTAQCNHSPGAEMALVASAARSFPEEAAGSCVHAALGRPPGRPGAPASGRVLLQTGSASNQERPCDSAVCLAGMAPQSAARNGDGPSCCCREAAGRVSAGAPGGSTRDGERQGTAYVLGMAMGDGRTSNSCCRGSKYTGGVSESLNSAQRQRVEGGEAAGGDACARLGAQGQGGPHGTLVATPSAACVTPRAQLPMQQQHDQHYQQQQPTAADPEDHPPVCRSDLLPVDTALGDVALPMSQQRDAALSSRVRHGACSGDRSTVGPRRPAAVAAARHADQLLTCVTLLYEQRASRSGEGGEATGVSTTELDHGSTCEADGRSNSSSSSSSSCRPSSWHRSSYCGTSGEYGSGARTTASSLPGISHRARSAPEGWGSESQPGLTSRPTTSVAIGGHTGGMTGAQPPRWQHCNSSASAPAVPVLTPYSRPKLYGPPAHRLPYKAAAGAAGASVHRVLSLGPVLENVPYCNDLNERLPYKPLDPPLPYPCPVLREDQAEPWPQQLVAISISMDM